MAGLLISGPAGGGKSQAAAEVVETTPDAVMVDYQAVYAGLLGIQRLPTGRYPERRVEDAYALPLAEYTRRAIITGAVARDLFVVVTNSDGNPARRSTLVGLLGAGASERVIDPGRVVVEARLTTLDGNLSEQCKAALGRWYGGL